MLITMNYTILNAGFDTKGTASFRSPRAVTVKPDCMNKGFVRYASLNRFRVLKEIYINA